MYTLPKITSVVCDTAKVRFFKQITTGGTESSITQSLFAILQKYDFSSKSQHQVRPCGVPSVVCDTAKVRFFKQITTGCGGRKQPAKLFAILQKYDFSSKSQHAKMSIADGGVVCDTAKVRFFKQITTDARWKQFASRLFAILQKYDFSSKSQLLSS